jgi:peptidoglycan/LPS O-acetylase OafA/YrhL
LQKLDPSDRICSLDGLRAVSIMMVLASHSTLTNGFPEYLRLPFAYLLDGQAGVQCFFVISGFLITSLLLKEESKRQSVSLKSFYIRRILRILPVYYLYIITILIWDCYSNEIFLERSTYVAAATFTTGLWGAGSWLLGHTWSLAVEEQFYLLWPAMFVLLSVRIRLRVALIFILLVPIFRIAVFHSSYQGVFSYLFVTQGDALMFGCILAIYLHRRKESAAAFFNFKPWVFRCLGLFCIFLSIYISGKTWTAFISIPFGGSIRAIGIAYLVGSFVVVRGGIVYEILNSMVMKWIGVLSYSLYIWQETILHPSSLEWWRSFPQNLVVVFIIASISYYGIEKQFLKFKDHFKLV